jgi:CO/xanthine dehydrogenase FAD-binding subunit
MSLTLQTFSRVPDAMAALKAPGARYLGGGTLLVRAANEGDVSIASFVRATDPALRAISLSDGRANIGASVTMSEIVRHPDLGFLAQAARAIGGPAIRNMATVGGNLFAPSPYGDFAVALLALDATVAVGGAEMSLEVFLAERDGAHAGKIVTAVSFATSQKENFRFAKAARVKPRGVSIVAIAAVIQETSGAIQAARIAFGGMANRPLRARAAESALVGRKRTKEGIEPALEVAHEGTSPENDAIASRWYRNQVLPVHLSRLLLA